MSNDTKWTPGPWCVGPVDDTVVTAPDGSEIAAIDGNYKEPDFWPVMEANARLIAAAPELYEALELALQEFDGFERVVKFQLPLAEKIRASLRKARGEP